MVTIKDVARLAGVSLSTASNALNGKSNVKLETKERVLEIAKMLNYIPNPIAKGLVTKSTRNISLIVSGPQELKLFSNPIFVDAIQGVAETFKESGYNTHLNVITTEEEEDIPNTIRSYATDGIILIGSRKTDVELSKILGEVKLPTIILIRESICRRVHSVSMDNWKCGYLATKHLIDMGHKRIGFLGSLPGVNIADQREAGYKYALEEAKIENDSTLVIPGDYYQESGYSGIRKIIHDITPRPTAVFFGNDLMALGAMEGITEEGISIPDDISIVGSDNIPNLHLLKTPLTSIASPFREIGSLASRKMIGILEGNDELPSHIILSSTLIERDSVRRL